jgi:hypothetical protein
MYEEGAIDARRERRVSIRGALDLISAIRSSQSEALNQLPIETRVIASFSMEIAMPERCTRQPRSYFYHQR